MQYRTNPKNGDSLSVLGYGCLRFSKKGRKIDQEKTEQELLYAITHGVNYIDTAYIYPGSEEAVGKFLAKGYRDQVYLASKLPHYLIKTIADADRIFAEELKRLQTECIDYYLMHMLSDAATWERLKSLGMAQWIAEKKQSGQIKNIGFSFHGGTDAFMALVDAYNWDFCQIQYNYVDETSQAGVRGLRYAHQKGLPVIIMEPLRGGKLANNLPKSVKALFDSATPKRSPVEWALRWLWDQEEVTVVLSGMNDLAQVEENVRIASDATVGHLTQDQHALLRQAKTAFFKDTKVMCTGCGYCMPCPNGVDIPTCFRCYNARYSDNLYTGMKEYFMCTSLKKEVSAASACIGCGKCETHCPQGISIRAELKNVRRVLENPVYRIMNWGAHHFTKL